MGPCKAPDHVARGGASFKAAQQAACSDDASDWPDPSRAQPAPAGRERHRLRRPRTRRRRNDRERNLLRPFRPPSAPAPDPIRHAPAGGPLRPVRPSRNHARPCRDDSRARERQPLEFRPRVAIRAEQRPSGPVSRLGSRSGKSAPVAAPGARRTGRVPMLERANASPVLRAVSVSTERRNASPVLGGASAATVDSWAASAP